MFPCNNKFFGLVDYNIQQLFNQSSHTHKVDIIDLNHVSGYRKIEYLNI